MDVLGLLRVFPLRLSLHDSTLNPALPSLNGQRRAMESPVSGYNTDMNENDGQCASAGIGCQFLIDVCATDMHVMSMSPGSRVFENVRGFRP